MKNTNREKMKIVALVVVAFFALGIVGLALTQSQVVSAAPAAKDSAIGYINVTKALQAHPDSENVGKTMQAEGQAAQKEFEEKSKGMNDQQKQEYYMQLSQRLQQKQAELMDAVLVKIEESVKKVAQAKGLTVVVNANTVVYGGVDITDDVIKAFGK